MSSTAWAFMGVAAVAALTDWWAKARERTTLEYVAKPLTLVVLLVAAATLDPVDTGQRTWFLAALLLSLVGDVLLMLPERDLGPADTFTFGLGSFLLGHVAFIAGFAHRGLGSAWVLAAAVLAAGVLVVIAPRIVRGARAHDPVLGIAVSAYIAVIVAMLLSAWWSGIAFAAIGATLFVSSDAMIGWSRFVRRFPGHELAIIVTYHLAQALLVVSLTQ